MKALFEPVTLLIWLPGLLFCVALVRTSMAIENGTATDKTKLLPLGLFIIAVVIAFLVPLLDMGKAVRFANTHDSHSGAGITSYADISFAARDAYFRTALPPAEQQGGFVSGGDLFDFGDPVDSDTTAQDQPDMALDGTAGEDREIVYQPQKGNAWVVLMLFLLCGSVFFLQGLRRFLPPRR